MKNKHIVKIYLKPTDFHFNQTTISEGYEADNVSYNDRLLIVHIGNETVTYNLDIVNKVVTKPKEKNETTSWSYILCATC